MDEPGLSSEVAAGGRGRWQKMSAGQTVGVQGSTRVKAAQSKRHLVRWGRRQGQKAEHRGIPRRMVYMWAVMESYSRHWGNGK